MASDKPWLTGVATGAPVATKGQNDPEVDNEGDAPTGAPVQDSFWYITRITKDGMKITSDEGLLNLLAAIVRRTPREQRVKEWEWLADIFEQPPDRKQWQTRRTAKPIRDVHSHKSKRKEKGSAVSSSTLSKKGKKV